ncbi:hypothetical protein I3842_07G053700 [Carya illinoinensis]|uniref:peroxidase n=1 Tax=Carya illinoinensis TaxID=32201 RepID=A0A922JC35_CARIL|nr:hypothetical protein I3842_07G053700 [Carya illinoinensis]
MASFERSFSLIAFAPLCYFSGKTHGGYLYPQFYDHSCPNAQQIVKSIVAEVVAKEARMAASLLRLHFHDCFGCDASLLLDNRGSLVSEKRSNPNRNSARGFEVLDEIKYALEKECPLTVSCADIVALAARVSTVLQDEESVSQIRDRDLSNRFSPKSEIETSATGSLICVKVRARPLIPSAVGDVLPYIDVLIKGTVRDELKLCITLVRIKDSTGASMSGSNNNIPAPNNTFQTILTKFKQQGLNVVDLVALAGSHTIGGNVLPDSTLDQSYAAQLRTRCPRSGGDENLFFLDFVNPTKFDNSYFKNLLSFKGLLSSDQVLLTKNEASMELVKIYSENDELFFEQFAQSMIKMGNISPLAGSRGGIRKNCRKINS